jgi:hypothetical protein
MSNFNSGVFLSNLALFTGTTQRYKTMFPEVKYTDGVKYVAENCESYWLIDLIVSYQTRQFREDYPFQVWKLTKTGDSAMICEDGNNNRLRSQKIKLTDFPLSEFTLWCVNGIIMVPSEY